jgi:membrane-bound metal-dependent hydrolase YbcI (DUF457 family)
MDSLTHGAAGAFIAWAWPQRWAVPKAATTCVTAALLPDADMFLPDAFNPNAVLAHRGLTHTLFGVAVLAPLVAIVPWWLTKKKGAYWSFLVLVALGMISHLVLDLPTELGLRIFWPFYPKYIYLEWLSGIDWTLFTVSVFVLLAAWTYAKPAEAVRRGTLSAALLVFLCCWLFAGWPLVGGRLGASLQTEEPVRSFYPIALAAVLLVLLVAIARMNWNFQENRARFGLLGLGAFAFYLLVCGTAHWAALRRIDNFTHGRSVKVLARDASRLEPSSFMAPVRWTGLVLAPQGVFQAEMSPLGPELPIFKFYPNAAENEFVTRARSIPLVQGYLAFTRFPVSCYEEDEGQHFVEFYDPWWGVGVVRVTLNQQREVISTRWVFLREYG